MAKTTIPIKNNVNESTGSLVFSISEFRVGTLMHLIKLGDLRLYLTVSDEGNLLTIKKGIEVLEAISFEGMSASIIISWENDSFWVSLFKDEPLPTYIGSSQLFDRKIQFDSYISLFEETFFNGSYKYVNIYNRPLHTFELDTFSLEIFEETSETTFSADFTTPTHYKKGVVIEDTFAPKDGSPILLSDEKGPLKRQYFFDELTGDYKESNTEYFTYLGERKIKLSYEGLDENYGIKIVFDSEGGNNILYENDKFTYHDHEITFMLTPQEIERFYGVEYSVTYKLERSYNIDFNKDVPHDGFRINLVNLKTNQEGESYSSTDQITLTREGNRFEDQYLAKEIELNPLVNPQVQGFMYIDKSDQLTQDFRMSVSSDYLTGDGIDTASLMVEAIDERGNEVLSPYVSVYLMTEEGQSSSSLGALEPIVGYNSLKARNTSGRLYYEFTAPIIIEDKSRTHKVFIIAYDRRSRIGTQIPIYIQSISNNPYNVRRKRNRYLEIPFEYFSRYFDRPLPEDHPLQVLDTNNNGYLDRRDLKEFAERAQDSSFMQGLTEELILLENNN